MSDLLEDANNNEVHDFDEAASAIQKEIMGDDLARARTVMGGVNLHRFFGPAPAQ
jgi:hypothetical protein